MTREPFCLKGGTARVELTPPIGGLLAGYFTKLRSPLGGPPRGLKSEGIHDPLYATALVLDNGEEKVAIVSCDLIGVPRSLIENTRRLIEEKTGIKRENVLIGATHTHSGPDIAIPMLRISPLLGYEGQDMDEVELDILARKIASSVIMAWQNRKEVMVGVGKGELFMGANRRDSQGPVDPEVGVIQVVDKNGEKIVCLINYSCHPIALGSGNLLITADFPYYTREALEALYGEEMDVLFLQGACGNINPHLRERSFREAERLVDRPK